MADTSGAAGLARYRVCPHWLGCEVYAEADCHERDLSAVIKGRTRAIAKRSRESALRAGPALSSAARSHPGPGIGHRRSAGGKSGRAIGKALPAAGTMEGDQRTGLSTGSWRRP